MSRSEPPNKGELPEASKSLPSPGISGEAAKDDVKRSTRARGEGTT
jgi:hypothetical protein